MVLTLYCYEPREQKNFRVKKLKVENYCWFHVILRYEASRPWKILVLWGPFHLGVGGDINWWIVGKKSFKHLLKSAHLQTKPFPPAHEISDICI